MATKTRARPGPQPARTVRLRGSASGKDGAVRHYFTCPDRIATLLPPEQRYEPVLVEEGVLYRRVVEDQAEPPSWVQRNGKGK